MLTIFYSPHMSSIDNEAGRSSGHADVPLTQKGKQQAHELGRYYTEEPLDNVFCSDLQRALITAQIAFAARSLRIVPDSRLRECDYGDLTQFPTYRVNHEFPLRITEPFPNGESVLMVVKRVGAFLRDVIRKYDGKTILIIGHRATKYGLEYFCSDSVIEKIVNTTWEWREIPVWSYKLDEQTLEQRLLAL